MFLCLDFAIALNLYENITVSKDHESSGGAKEQATVGLLLQKRFPNYDRLVPMAAPVASRRRLPCLADYEPIKFEHGRSESDEMVLGENENDVKKEDDEGYEFVSLSSIVPIANPNYGSYVGMTPCRQRPACLAAYEPIWFQPRRLDETESGKNNNDNIVDDQGYDSVSLLSVAPPPPDIR
jgi:hypothetical protein